MTSTYKGKCPNCGSTLETTYHKNGTMVKFCPHVQAHIVKSGIGMLKHLEVYCQGIVKALEVTAK